MQTAIDSIDHPLTESSPLTALLRSSLAQTSAQSAYVYRFDPDEPIADLAAWAGAAVARDRQTVAGAAVTAHASRTQPIVMQENAWADLRFAIFPEFRAERFEGVASIPLVDAGAVVGVANFCLRGGAGLRARELEFLLGLSLPLGALLAGAAVREKLQTEVARLSQQLAGRKAIDRAKGLLQSRFGWSEDEAYHHVRRLSRQRRIPMHTVAAEVIQHGA
jgi:signal transduction protein with GAF and PtsI domain